ncbi:hypothetical protein HXX76_002980 [Chlamydomonas incerta]|uniref:Uncharacterized protein n=1 Tax=Chlamydomonas incerta TaxID=51695 RepID=A0A835W9C8_CHLIN|nr:hypothetical protein HXX76_002980 [Chlamydomonas incerta]|eukprot:KAG2442904.1 hypothetical protein HXX76_002980 [Chlamydomonas incerta]
MAAALGGGGPAAGAHLISSPSFKASAAPAGPGVVVVKDAVKLVVHHYRASDDSDEGDDADASRQNSAASDGEPAQPRGPQGPQVSGLVRFLAVLCCMAPAKPQHKKRRRRSRKPSALSSEVLAPEEHLIGAHQNVTDFKGKYQRAQAKAQALVPVPAIKRCASNAGFALPSPSAGDPSGHYGTSISGTGTEDARTVSGGSRPPHQPSLVSPFATQSVPNGGSPVTRTASMRSPGDVRLLGGMRSSPLQSQSVDGYMDVVGWSPVGTAGGGVAGGSGSGRALSGGSPQAYTGSMFVAGDSGGGLSRISSFDGSCPSGQLPAETAEPSSRLVQCLKLELVAGASSSLDGAGSMTPEALTERHQERTVTGSSVNGYGKRGVRWQ